MNNSSYRTKSVTASSFALLLSLFYCQSLFAQLGPTVELTGSTSINTTLRGTYGLAVDDKNPPQYPEGTSPEDTYTLEYYSDLGQFQWNRFYSDVTDSFNDTQILHAATRYYPDTKTWQGGLIGSQQPRNARSFGDNSELLSSISVNSRKTPGLQIKGTSLSFRGTAEVLTDNTHTSLNYQVFDSELGKYVYGPPAEVTDGLNSSWSTTASITTSIDIDRRHRYEFSGDRSGFGIWEPGTHSISDIVSASATSATGTSDSSSDSFNFDVKISPIERHLTLITHGWTSEGAAFADQMRDNIVDRLNERVLFNSLYNGLDGDNININGNLSWSEFDTTLDGLITDEKDQWDVVSFDWSSSASLLNTWLWPPKAKDQATALGNRFGDLIAEAGYDSVHLIGHSAGSWFIDAVSDRIKLYAEEHDVEKPSVHLTFLDPFIYPMTSNVDLGDSGDWVEQYLHLGGLPYTNEYIENGYTIDVTELDPTPESADSFFLPLSRWSNGHSFPVEFYMGTTLQPYQPDIIAFDAQGGGNSSEYIEVDNEMIPTYGWGFQNSLEMDGYLPNHSYLPRGEGLRLTSTGTEQIDISQDYDGPSLIESIVNFLTGHSSGSGSASQVTDSGVTLELTASSSYDKASLGNISQDYDSTFGINLPDPDYASQDPLIYTLDIVITEPADLIRFDILFEEIGSGVLYIGIEGTWLYMAGADSFEADIVYDSSWLYLGNGLEIGTYEVMFALDRLDETATSVRIENLQFGRSTVAIPEPTSLWILVTLSMIRLGRRLKQYK